MFNVVDKGYRDVKQTRVNALGGCSQFKPVLRTFNRTPCLKAIHTYNMIYLY